MNRTLEDIYHAALKFLVPLRPEKTFETVVAEAIKLVNGKEGSIFLQQDGNLQRVYTTNKKLYEVIPRKNGFTVQTFLTGKPHLRHIATLRKINPVFKAIPIESDITIALSYEDKSIGVLSILSKKDRKFRRKDLHILRLFAPLATLAIRKTQLYDQAKKALETRDLFISMASHELKTPLTTINLYSQLLKDNVANGLLPKKEWMDTLTWEVVRLTMLVNELLRIDQIKTGELQYNWKPCPVREIVNRAISDFEHTHPTHPITFIDKLNSHQDLVNGDYDKLLQVIFNVFNNAAKFSKPRDAIEVILSPAKNAVKLSVIDHGKGIAAKDLPNIFQRFYKGGDHAKEGMGLGLFLSKKIIDEHGGTIDVDSKPNKGTAMIITLPTLSHKRNSCKLGG